MIQTKRIRLNTKYWFGNYRGENKLSSMEIIITDLVLKIDNTDLVSISVKGKRLMAQTSVLNCRWKKITVQE